MGETEVPKRGRQKGYTVPRPLRLGLLIISFGFPLLQAREPCPRFGSRYPN